MRDTFAWITSPIALMEKFAQFAVESVPDGIQKVALGVDIRSGESLDALEKILENMAMNHLNYEILYLDADDDVLIKRYKETRRSHPLAGTGRVETGDQQRTKQAAVS